MNSTSKKKLVTLKFCLPRARRAVFKKIAEKIVLSIVTSSAAFLDSFIPRQTLSTLLTTKQPAKETGESSEAALLRQQQGIELQWAGLHKKKTQQSIESNQSEYGSPFL